MVYVWEAEGTRDKESFHLLVQSPNAQNNWNGGRARVRIQEYNPGLPNGWAESSQ